MNPSRSLTGPADNQAFSHSSREAGRAFVPCHDPTVLDDRLCEHHERTVGSDNCVHYRRRVLPIPTDRHRCHYVKAKVKGLHDGDDCLAIHHGPRRTGPIGCG